MHSVQHSSRSSPPPIQVDLTESQRKKKKADETDRLKKKVTDLTRKNTLANNKLNKVQKQVCDLTNLYNLEMNRVTGLINSLEATVRKQGQRIGLLEKENQKNSGISQKIGVLQHRLSVFQYALNENGIQTDGLQKVDVEAIERDSLIIVDAIANAPDPKTHKERKGQNNEKRKAEHLASPKDVVSTEKPSDTEAAPRQAEKRVCREIEETGISE